MIYAVCKFIFVVFNSPLRLNPQSPL